MSGIAGIYNRCGRPVDAGLVKRMTDVIAYRGPDAEGLYVDGPVGLGHRMLYTTLESLDERQPMTDESGDYCITADARVDNRKELEAALVANGLPPRARTDAELILKAYRCWGENCLEKILGDFAFAIWDKPRRALFCARDPVGIKPFYYHLGGEEFAFGSEIKQIFQKKTIAMAPNEVMMGDYLVRNFHEPEETFYKGILRLPAAHFLVVSDGKVRKQRYFDFDPTRTRRYGSDAEYAEAFLSLFDEAVRCRLRSAYPIGCFLSGGLDSSSITCMAVKALAEEGGAANAFETFSVELKDDPANESEFAQAVAKQCNLVANCLLVEQVGTLADFADIDQRLYYQETPDLDPTPVPSRALCESAHQKGMRIVLTGLGGDNGLAGNLYYLYDLARQCQLLGLVKEMRGAMRESNLSAYRIFREYVLMPALSHIAPAAVKSLLAPVLQSRRYVPGFIDAGFARKVDLLGRLRNGNSPRAVTSRFVRDEYEAVISGWVAGELEAFDRSLFPFPLEARHPFFDRRLLEFLLSIPRDQKVRYGLSKVILRNALRGILPEKVRRRVGKSTDAFVINREMRAFRKETLNSIIDSLQLASLGLVDKERAKDVFCKFCRGKDEYFKHLWQIITLELWYRKFFGSAVKDGNSAFERADGARE